MVQLGEWLVWPVSSRLEGQASGSTGREFSVRIEANGLNPDIKSVEILLR